MAIQGKKKRELTMDAILDILTPFDIFRYYMPTKDWELNVKTNSPFREDRNPSFIIGNKNGYLSFIDFGHTDDRGDCFGFVRRMFNLATLNDVLEKIDNDFQLGIRIGVPSKEYQKITSTYTQPIVTKRNTLIQVQTRKFTSEELAYWAQYHQTEKDLHENNIYSVKKAYLDKQLFHLRDEDLRFGYFYDGYWKIYRPFRDKKSKWVPNNVPITTMDGKNDIKGVKKAFINKSKKDYMVVKKVFSSTCAVQNEGIACFSVDNINYIKENSEIQILGFDSDTTGVENSQQITKMFNFDYCNVPRKYLQEGIKDFADLAKVHGLKAVEEVLKQKGII